MLNLTALLLARPTPIKHARFVRGYAMSGCKESSELGLPTDMEQKIAAAKAEAKARSKVEAEKRKQKMMSDRKLDIAARFRRAMEGRGWLSTEEVAKCVAISKSNTLIALSGLADAGLIVKRALRNQKNQTKFEWSWKK